jgi:subtilisin family serine protease
VRVFRRHPPAIVALLGVLLCLTTASGQQPIPAPAAVAGEILVKFRRSASIERRNAAAAGRAARLLRRFIALDTDHLRLDPGQRVDDAIDAWRRDPDVAAVQPNYLRQAVGETVNDPLLLNETLWGFHKIQAPAAWSRVMPASATVVVANIDSGVNYRHPDLAANMWVNPAETPGDGIDNDGNGYADDVHGINAIARTGDPLDDHGHGTHTAGTLAATGNNGIGVVGVHYKAKIVACKFLSASGTGTDAGAVECFNYVTALKRRGVNIRVTSNSWGAARGGAVATVLQSAVDAAGEAGILNVFAAGNGGVNNDAQPFDPASYPSPSIVSVAASDVNDRPASLSNYGAASVDLAAPGIGITSTYGSGYGTLNGTSMATPLVAGAAALLAEIEPGLALSSIKTRVLGAVDAVAEWAGLTVTGGRLNLFRLLVPAITVSSLSLTTAQPVVTGVPLTLAATASGGSGSLEYQFWRYHMGTQRWTLLQAYSPGDRATWTPQAADAGSYYFMLWVRSVGSVNDYDAWRNLGPIEIQPPAPRVTSFTCSPGTLSLGATLDCAATSAGGEPVEYKFYDYSVALQKWSMIQDYSATPTVSWRPAVAGQHWVQVWVRNREATVDYQDWRPTGPFTVIEQPLTLRSEQRVATASSGVPLTWAVQASGGVPPLQFRFYVFTAATNTWSMVQDYSQSNTMTWSPPAPGQYALMAWARNASSSADYDAYLGTGYFQVTP